MAPRPRAASRPEEVRFAAARNKDDDIAGRDYVLQLTGEGFTREVVADGGQKAALSDRRSP